MNQPKNNPAPDAVKRSLKVSQSEGADSKNAQSVQRSRRQLLSQGMNAGLGLMLFPQLPGLANGRWRMRRRSLLSLAAAAGQKPSSTKSNQGPITVTIHFTAQADQSEALLIQLRQALPKARQAPGCRNAQLYVVSAPSSSSGQSERVVLFKQWDSRSAQAQYLQREQRSGQLAKLLALAEGEPVVEYWEFQRG